MPAANYHTGLNATIAKMNNVFDDVENLAKTIIPLPYAQITRLITVLFLAVLPFQTVRKLKWFAIISEARDTRPHTVCATLIGGPGAGR